MGLEIWITAASLHFCLSWWYLLQGIQWAGKYGSRAIVKLYIQQPTHRVAKITLIELGLSTP
jgi:hypothetical protein